MKKRVIGILIVSILIFGVVGVYAFNFVSLDWVNKVGGKSNEKGITGKDCGYGV